MYSKNIKVLGIGSPIVDILVSVDDNFLLSHVTGEKGGMVLADLSVIDAILAKTSGKKHIVPAGSSANTILALSKLGIQTGFLGKISDDHYGKFYTKNYKKAGGDTSRFKKNPNVPTGCCLSLVTPDSQRTMRTYLGAAATIQPEDISEDDFVGYGYLHIEGYMIHNEAVIRKALKLAKKAALTVSLDLASFEIVRDNLAILKELLDSYVDIVFCNEDEAEQFSGSKKPEDLFKKLEDVCDTVALKMGRNGALIKSGKEIVKIDAHIVQALDSTGAGDLWQAGFLYGIIKYKDSPVRHKLKKAGKFGSILGAEVVQVMGPSIPDKRWIKIRNTLM